jgi:hypothetical protein
LSGTEGSDITNSFNHFKGYVDHRTADAYRLILGAYESLRKLLAQEGQRLLSGGSRAATRVTAAEVHEEMRLLLTYIETAIDQIRKAGGEAVTFGMPHLEEAYTLLEEVVEGEIQRLTTTGLARFQTT